MNQSLLSQVPLFATLPSAELMELERTLPQATYPAQTVLFHEGDHGDRFYVVLRGAIAIIKALDTPDERLVAVRGPGEFIGEMSLLNRDGLRTASVRVEREAHVLELTRADFDALLHRYPTLAYEMLRVLSARLNQSHASAIADLHEKNQRLAQAYADLKAAQAQIIEQETLKRELQLAYEIQQSMLPRVLPQAPGVDIGAQMVPARMVGGDFYDVFALGSDRLGLAIGDVSGKGMPAALFMALTCSLLRAEASRGTPPEEALRNVNRQLLGMNTKSMFVTLLYGVLDCPTRAFTYVRAGHDLPMVWDAERVSSMPPRGPGNPLGFLAEPALDTQSMLLRPGDTLLLYTDGVTEAMDPEGSFFGLEQLDAIVRAAPATNAQGLCDHLVDVLTDFHATAPQADDITVLAIRVD